ncbi:MAG: succinyl-diaminopimelate desuccinylase [Myxococcales bacterium]|nr:succinyl-diaminopimelate desuccinylase [Myxococcales bacterium]
MGAGPDAIDPAVARTLDETLLWLCSVDSPIGEEKALCDAVSARMQRIALAAPIRRYGDSIVVPVTRAAGGAPKIALVGHLDTVRTENGPARVDGDRVFGAGSSDMKSGLAIMIAIAELAAQALPCDLTLVFYAREEGPYADNELGPVLDQDPELRHVDLAVCLEPSDNKLHLGCTGSIHATVTVRGRTSHSARPWEGQNAITRAAPLLTRLAAVAPVEHHVEGLVYRTVTTVTQARDGGRGRNVVPDVFTLNVNHRFAPVTSLEQAQADLTALLGDEGEITFTDLSPAAMPSAEHPLVKKLVAAGVVDVAPKQAWTDVARFSALGVPAVNFGPGENAQAHQKNESTSLSLVHDGYGIFLRWLSSVAPHDVSPAR